MNQLTLNFKTGAFTLAACSILFRGCAARNTGATGSHLQQLSQSLLFAPFPCRALHRTPARGQRVNSDRFPKVNPLW